MTPANLGFRRENLGWDNASIPRFDSRITARSYRLDSPTITPAGNCSR